MDQLAALQASVTSDQEIGVDCGPGSLEPFSYVPIVWGDVLPIYEKEAEMGNRIAVNNLGVCLQFGRGIAKDEKAAVAAYQKAIKQGSVLAINNLSMCYLRGVGVEMDEEKAIGLLEPLAERGCLMAVSNIGSCYLNGEGVKKDPRRAMDWYERAANEGFAPSQCYLGVMFESGACREVGKNDAAAAEWFEKAAAQNFKYACYNVAVCYEQGEGVEKDEKKAAEFYERAAIQGELDAMYEVGLCYLYGSGVRRDIARAMGWLTKAAGQGHVKASRVCDIERVQSLDVETQAQSRISAHALPNNRNLLSIRIFCHQIDQINLLHICEVLRLNSTLQTFVMDGTDGVFGDVLAEECAAALATPTTGLYRLRLYANLQRAKGTIAIAEAMHTNRSLAHLDLSCNYITADGCHAITKAIGINRHIMSLNLAGCDLKGDSAQPLFTAIATHPSLTSLDFSQNFFGADAGLVLGKALATTNRALTSLYLHACALTAPVVASITNALRAPDAVLSTLQLSSNQLGSESITALASALASSSSSSSGGGGNTSLTSLNISLNPIGDAGSRALADALVSNSTLTELKMDDTDLTAAGITPWANTIARNTGLMSIALDHFVDCTAAIGTALGANTVLRELTLTHQYFHHSSEASPVCRCGDTLLASLHSNRSLRVLRAPQCSCQPRAEYANPAAAAVLAQSLQRNTHLSVTSFKQNPTDDVLSIIDRNMRTHRRVDRNWQPICILVPYMRANTATALGATGADFLQTILKMCRD